MESHYIKFLMVQVRLISCPQSVGLHCALTFAETIFVVADRNIHIIQKTGPATNRLFRNVWKTEQVGGEGGAIILKGEYLF